ncbi:MAG: single-stranded-DNA-specific exonuclease RecJ [Alphaproteobacteria bacterium]|nr:single-stranded-DNA-specific exonuclease RecJ [Alphaproteobacteria bacterium]
MAESAARLSVSDGDAPFLGVARSASGKRWRLRAGDDRLGLALAQRLDLPEALGRALAARGVTLDRAEDFLQPTLRRDLPDPFHLKGMEQAVARIVRAIRDGERAAVFGDYDVDGATASALLIRFFRAVGADLIPYIPDRLKEGYGPNAAALERLRRERGCTLAITVDCGITAFDPLAHAEALGLDMIVVDHHAAEPRLPPAAAVVNPNRLDDASPHGHLAAVGVAFLLVVAVNKALREAGWYGASRPEPDLRQWLDLVALGTVCDVVPLVGVNRALVAQGLKVMARRRNIGLAALADVARVDSAPGTYHAGFLMGPRVNAGGRVGEADLGVRLLSTEDPRLAAELAQRLDGYNAERQEIERLCLEQAVERLEAGDGLSEGLVYVEAAGWHPGVIGIVAGRLKERYNRPACVVALDDKGVGKGSGRSVEGVDLGAAVIAARQSELLVNGGGHKMAAGFTTPPGGGAAFCAFLAARIADQTGPGGVVPELSLDGALHVAGASLDLARALERLQPFGPGNAEPRFALSDARVVQADVVGRDHVRAILAGGDGGRVKAIAFRCADQPLGETLLRARGGAPIHLAGRVRVDSWRDREEAQVMIDDAAEPGAAR